MTELTAADLAQRWATARRWVGTARTFTAEDVVRLAGTAAAEHSLARGGAERLWAALERGELVDALGPTTVGQAVEMGRGGIQAIHLRDRRTATDPRPTHPMPGFVRRIHDALLRADRIATAEGGKGETDWLVPIVTDAEPGFGAHLTVFELTRAMINALTATLLTSDVDDLDTAFCTGERTADGFHRVRPGIESAIHRGRAYAPYADLLWMETASPDLYEARQFAEAIHASHPDQKLAYRCSPSFGRADAPDDEQIARLRRELAAMGYSFQSVVPAGVCALDRSTVCEQVA